MWIPWTSYFSLLLEVAVVVNLARNGLFRVYKWFLVYLSADFIETVIGAIYQKDFYVYGWIYFTGQTAKMVLAVLVVLELYRLALQRHPALARFGRMSVIYVLGGAALLALLGLTVYRGIPGDRSQALHEFFSFERTMDLWMLLFLLAIGAFMVWFPVALKRNSALYIGGFIFYFLARSAALLALNMTSRWKTGVSDAMLIVSDACLLMWLFALTEQGESIETVVGHRWDPVEARRLTTQLDAVNVKLSRFLRS